MVGMKSPRKPLDARNGNVDQDRPQVEGELPPPSRAIRNARTARGLSLRALSARAGLPYSTLSKLEKTARWR